MQKPISVGTVISHRYQVQKKIHDNTFNSCYLAEDSENNNRLVILSLPRIELLILADFSATFAEVSKKLMTRPLPGLLKTLGYGEHNSQPYAVIQHVTDETLEDVLGRKRLAEVKVNLDTVLDWATPLAVTLDELHSMSYVHGSLKPSTVYIGSQKILMGDFITEWTLQEMGKFKSGITSLDVDQYLSPEYLKSTYTANYDQYLLATMVYEALAGKVPFARSKGGDDYRMQVATHVSPLLTAHRPELKAVSDVLAKAMKRKPVDRYKSCRAFIADLQEAQLAEPSKPPPQKRVVITTPFSDEPEDEEVDEAAVASAQRINAQRSGGKKGLLWVGGLFLAGGAAAFAAINYPQLIGLDKSNQEQVTEVEAPDAAPAISVSASSESQEPDSTKEESTTAEQAVVVTELKPEVSVIAPTEDVQVDEATITTGSPESEVAAKDVNTDTLAELDTVINQALESGYERFNEVQKAEVAESAEQAALEQAVTLALLKGRDDFMSKAATEVLADIQAPEAAVEVATNNIEEVTSPVQPVPAEVVAPAEVEPEVVAEPVTPEVVEETLAATAEIIWEESPADATTPEAVAASARASEAIEAPVLSPEEIKQKERERIQAIKQQKLARIKSITEECTVGGRIHRETAAGNLAYVKSCLSVGVKPNITQSNGWTLLHIAARNGNLNICKLLIAKGAVVGARANNGQTAIDMANAFRQDRVVAYLKTRGGVISQ